MEIRRHIASRRGITVFPVLSLVLLALAFAGCGGGGGGGAAPGTPPATPQTLVTVSGQATATVPPGGSLAPVRAGSGVRPLAAGTVTGFDNASIKAIDYATGLAYAIPKTPPTSDNVTDGNGNFSVDLPKGKDFILTFERVILSGPNAGKTARLGAVVPNAYEGQLVPVNDETSLVAAAISPTINGTKKDLTQTYIDNVLALINQVDPTLISNLTLDNFTIGAAGSFIGGNVQQGLVPPPGNDNVKAIHDNVITLIAGLPAPPGVPTLSASAGDGQVVLSWPAVTGATSYNLYFGDTNSVTRGNGTKIPGVASPYTHGGRTNGTSYYYVLTAVNAGGESAESGLASATPRPPIPGVPVNVTVTPGNGQVSISWDPVAGAASYNIYWGTTAGVTKSSPNKIPVSGTSTIHTGRTNGTTYYYIVTAVNMSGESVASAEASATPVVPPYVPVLDDAKAMIADLRNTAQSLTNYRNRGDTASNGILDNAAANLKTQIDTVVAPYFQSFATSFRSFVDPSGEALGRFPAGGSFVWNANRTLSYSGSRPDSKWVIHTFDGLNITLSKAATGSLLLTPVDFDVTSDLDNTLKFQGTFSNVQVTSVTVDGVTYGVVTNATVNGYFANKTTGSGTTQRLNVNGSLAMTLDGAGTITGFTLGGSFSSHVLSGSATLAVTCSVGSTVYTGDGSSFVGQISRIALTGATLNIAGKGTFSGSFRIDLVPGYLTEEEFSVKDNGMFPIITDMILYWDERGGGRKLVDLDVGWGWYMNFGGGERWINQPPTGSGNSWTIVLNRGNGSTSTYTFTVDRTQPAVPTISGTVNNHEWTGSGFTDYNVPFTTVDNGYLGKVAIYMYPSYATFSGTYTNADASVPFTSLTGTLTANYINWASSNPFFLNRYEPFTAANFPQVNVRFDGEIRTPLRPAIVGTADATSSYAASGASGNPTPGFGYAKVAGTTSYQDGFESITGTGTAYIRDERDTTGKSYRYFERATLKLVNAKSVTFDLQWNQPVHTNTTTLTGSLYYHPPTGSNTVFGNVEYVNALPIIRWSDGTFESIP